MKGRKITRDDWKALVREFQRYETVRGTKSVRKIPYVLKPFFVYLEERDYELFEINYKRAQDYQTYLSTLEDAGGSIHYSAMAVGDMMNIAGNFYNFLKAEKLVPPTPSRTFALSGGEAGCPGIFPKRI